MSKLLLEAGQPFKVHFMEDTTDRELYTVYINSCHLAELFCEAICTGQIAYRDWYDLMTVPFNDSFSIGDEDLLTRLIYAVRQGRVKIIE